MGTADISILIQEIQVLSTLKGHFHTVMLRLSASAIDTARAMLTVRTQGRAAELRPIDITEI